MLSEVGGEVGAAAVFKRKKPRSSEYTPVRFLNMCEAMNQKRQVQNLSLVPGSGPIEKKIYMVLFRIYGSN